jgi:hypothetical protein
MKKQLIYNLIAAGAALCFAWIFYYESLICPRLLINFRGG